MPKVKCTLKSATSPINGPGGPMDFEPLKDGTGMVSVDDIADDVVEALLTIPGYEIYVEPKKPTGPAKKLDADKAPDQPPADPQKPADMPPVDQKPATK